MPGMDTPGIRTHGGDVSSHSGVFTAGLLVGTEFMFSVPFCTHALPTHMAVVATPYVTTNVSGRRGNGLLVVAGGQLVECGPRGGCRERQGRVNCRATAAATTQPRVLLPSRGPRPPPRARYVNITLLRAVATVGRARRPPAEPARPLARPASCVCVRLCCARVCVCVLRGCGPAACVYRPTQRAVCRFFAWFLLTLGAAASSSRVKRRAARGVAGGWTAV
jgi:hypothetical protein